MKHYQVKPGDTYVEGGANVGRTAFLAQAMGAKAILIEPSPLNITVIEKKMSQGYFTNINPTLIKKALWKEKKLGFFILAGGKADRLGESGEKVTSVECDTLPNILEDLKIEKVNLFACDIEGVEAEIVQQLDPKVELNLAIASYHLGNLENVEKQIMNVLEAKNYKNIVYEDGLVYASAK